MCGDSGRVGVVVRGIGGDVGWDGTAERLTVVRCVGCAGLDPGGFRGGCFTQCESAFGGSAELGFLFGVEQSRRRRRFVARRAGKLFLGVMVVVVW